MTSFEIVEPAVIKTALEDPAMVPPRRPGNGPTLVLRSEMARFSDALAHPRRRAEVIAAIELVNVEVAVCAVENEARVRRKAGESLIEEISRAAPIAGVAVGLGMIDGVERASVERLVDDVESVVEVIGRGADSSPESDAATLRLLKAAGEVAPGGSMVDPVAVVSILYQSMDATAALIREMEESRRFGADRAPAIRKTVREATIDSILGGVEVVAGDEVVLMVGAAGLEFGHGPHVCPGRTLAGQLAAAVLATAPGD